MLTIKNLTKSVGARTLFSGASMTINYGERVALVGPNGAGKSTLFSLILGQDEPDKGNIERDEWTTVGFLPQESEPVAEETALEVATGRAGEMERLEQIEVRGANDTAQGAGELAETIPKVPLHRFSLTMTVRT